MMDAFTQDALERAARLSRLERAATAMENIPIRRRDGRPLLAAVLALLLTLYPGMSAAAELLM